MQSLKDKVSIRKVKEALAQLPRGSGSAASKIAYDETMNRIRGQEKGFCELAIATLSWISLAIRPLTLRELKCALSIEPGDTAMDEANFVDEETLGSVCAGLIVVDHESQIVHLAHYTTQEYFESQQDVLFLDKQNLLATTCLTYLSFDAFSNWQLRKFGTSCCWYSQPPGPLAAPDERESYIYCYPLLRYAAAYWHEHAHSSQGPTVERLVIGYLKRTENLAALLNLENSYDWYLPESFSPQNIIHGLLIAAKYGFTDAVKALLHSEGYCAEDSSRIKAQALSLAAFYGQSSALRILLDGNLIRSPAVSQALQFMYTREGAPPASCEVAEILLNHGADANSTLGDTPLIHLASRENDVQLANLLLSHGADVGLRDWTGGTALHNAAERGHSGDMVKVLLRNGADIHARRYNDETPLMTAVGSYDPEEPDKHMSLITQLLECGGSVNQYHKFGYTALHWAALGRRVKIACQLLEAGADVNAEDAYGKIAADHLDGQNWEAIREKEKAECEEILARHGFFPRGKKRAVYDSDEVVHDSDDGAYDSDEDEYME